jgi:hypothetical protein
MAVTHCNLKIIFYNILLEVQIEELSSSIEHCDTIEETVSCIDNGNRSGHQIFVVCRQHNLQELEDQNRNGSIGTMYILDEHAVNIQNNNKRIITSNGRDLKNLIMIGAATHIVGVATKTQDEDGIFTDGMVTALIYAASRLLDLVQNSNN